MTCHTGHVVRRVVQYITSNYDPVQDVPQVVRAPPNDAVEKLARAMAATHTESCFDCDGATARYRCEEFRVYARAALAAGVAERNTNVAATRCRCTAPLPRGMEWF